MSHTQLYVVALLCLASAARHAAGQGLVPSSVPRVGATNTLTQLQQQYRNSQAWKRAYKQRPRSACGKSGGASLCAAQNTDAADAYAQLMLATSPQAYSSTSSSGPRLVSPALDQAPCQTCTAFAVAAAAETAMAAALQVDVQQCSISAQALFFCVPGRPTRSCEAGWNLADALQQLQQRGQSLPTTSCLPYKPDVMGDLSADVLCKGRCNTPNQHASSGTFSSQEITSVWRAQRHIRQHGAVVSRFDVYSDFNSFFSDKRNAQAVYRPSAGAEFRFLHAITLVGYNNEQEYWVAKNSYGSSWGDNGLFKVAYGVGSIMAADKGEAFGIVWTPSSTPGVLQLPVTPGPRPDCYWYKARPGDYLSKVAWLAGIPLDNFMLDNTDQVKDLDASLQGLQLLLCKPKQGAVKFPGTRPAPTPVPMPTPTPSSRVYPLNRWTGVVATITPGNGGAWGGWGELAKCPAGFWASSLSTRAQPYQGWGGDDSGINAVRMQCSNAAAKQQGAIESHPGFTGDWSGFASCPAGQYIVGLRQLVEPNQGVQDDTAANGLMALCSDRTTVLDNRNNLGFGGWSEWAMCPSGSAVCTFRVKVEQAGATMDDTGMNDIQAECCKL